MMRFFERSDRWFHKAGRAGAFAACLMTFVPSAWSFEPALTPQTASQTASSVQSLIASLQSQNAHQRKDAAEALTWMGTEARPALPALLNALKDPNPLVRANAARAVWEIDQWADAAVPVLVDLLHSQNTGHRELAAYFLGPMGTQAQAAVPALQQTLTDSNAILRIHAAEALAQINPSGTVAADVLVESLKDPRAEVRSLAAMAFSNVDSRHAGRVVPALMAALADSNASVRTAAELALPGFNLSVSHSGDEISANSANSHLVDFPEASEFTSIPAEAITAPFAKPVIQPAAAQEPVEAQEPAGELERAVRNLTHSDPAVRRNALERISWLGPDAEPAIVDVTLCLNDPQLENRAYAAKTLWDIDKQSALAAVNTLRDLIDSTKPGIRGLAAFYLGYIGPKASSALPDLKRALANTESVEQLQIAEAVARIRPEDPDAVNVLIGGLSDVESGIRFQAAYALAEVSPVHARRVVPQLATATADQSPEVRRAAEFALTNFPQPAPVEPVRTAQPVSHQQPLGTSRVALLDPEPVAARVAMIEVAGVTQIVAEPAGVAHAEQPRENNLGLGDDYKPINSLTVSISPKRRNNEGKLLDLPTNYGAAWLATQGKLDQPSGQSRPWAVQSVQYAASGFCHRPLYFEEINLERYGHNFGCCLQPFVSAAHFYGRVPLMPYMMAAECDDECQCTLGHYRAGSCAPYYVNHLPWSTKGALLEAGIVTGLFFAIY